MESVFDTMGGTYRQCGDYLIPEIALPDTEKISIGKYGRMRQRYLKEHRGVLYNAMILDGTFWRHVAEVDKICKERMDGQIKEDFHELYLLLNGMPPRDMDKIIKFTRSKEKYKADHAAELKQFYQARRKLSAQFPDGKFDRHKLEAEYARLEQEHDETYAQFKSIRADSQQLWKIKSCVDSARKNQEQTQQQNHRRQEQEI